MRRFPTWQPWQGLSSTRDVSCRRRRGAHSVAGSVRRRTITDTPWTLGPMVSGAQVNFTSKHPRASGLRPLGPARARDIIWSLRRTKTFTRPPALVTTTLPREKLDLASVRRRLSTACLQRGFVQFAWRSRSPPTSLALCCDKLQGCDGRQV